MHLKRRVNIVKAARVNQIALAAQRFFRRRSDQNDCTAEFFAELRQQGGCAQR